MRKLYANGWVVTMDDAGTEHPNGWVLVDGAEIVAVGGGEEPGERLSGYHRIDCSGGVIAPGLINTHHHLYQTLTRARAQEADLFTWLRELYPIWQRIDAEAEHAAARAGLAELAFSGCTTVFDHHYVFPQGRTGIVEAEVQAARELGVRLVAARGSMDLGASQGAAARLARREPRRDPCRHRAPPRRAARGRPRSAHPARRGAVLPVLRTSRLLQESAALARRLGLQLHTHLAETVEEEAYCRELHGCSPVEYLERLGWLADDVWCAHCVHLSQDEVGGSARRGWVSALPDLEPPARRGRRPRASAPRGGSPCWPRRRRVGVQRARRPPRGGEAGAPRRPRLRRERGHDRAGRAAARDARRGRRPAPDDIGSLEAGKQADLAIWPTDGLEFGGAEDLVAGLVLSGPHRVDRLVVGGEDVVRAGDLAHADEHEIAATHRAQARRFAV